MSDSTWLLLQLCVAGWAGFLMWGLVRLAGNIWNRRTRSTGSRECENDKSHPTLRPRVIGDEHGRLG